MSRVPLRTFFFYSILGGVAWVTVAVSLGYFLWVSLRLVEHRMGQASAVLLAVLLVTGGVI
jgi:membrane-associated protein